MKTRLYAAPAVEGLRLQGIVVSAHGIYCILFSWARILVQVTIYRRLRIGRDGHLDQSKAYDIAVAQAALYKPYILEYCDLREAIRPCSWVK